MTTRENSESSNYAGTRLITVAMCPYVHLFQRFLRQTRMEKPELVFSAHVFFLLFLRNSTVMVASTHALTRATGLTYRMGNRVPGSGFCVQNLAHNCK
jgi:hypothetical protein